MAGRPKFDMTVRKKGAEGEEGKNRRVATIWLNDNGKLSLSAKFEPEYHSGYPQEVQQLIKLIEALREDYWFNFFDKDDDRGAPSAGRPSADF